MARSQKNTLIYSLALAILLLTSYALNNFLNNKEIKQQPLSKDKIPGLKSINITKEKAVDVEAEDSGFSPCHPRYFQAIELSVREQIHQFANEKISHDAPALAKLVRENFIDKAAAATLSLERPIHRTLQAEAVDKLLK